MIFIKTYKIYFNVRKEVAWISIVFRCW